MQLSWRNWLVVFFVCSLAHPVEPKGEVGEAYQIAEIIMSGDVVPGAGPAFDIQSLLRYDGPSLREDVPISDGIVLLDYSDTDANERNIGTLLSSQNIPFFLDRTRHGWTGSQMPMRVTVPSDRWQQAAAVLSAAVKASAIDVVGDGRGPRSR